MIFAIWFTGGPETERLRMPHRPDHLRFVIEQRDALLYGGACLDEDRAAMVGMLMVIDVDSREEAERFVAEEPYARAGSFSEISILAFGQRVPEPFQGFFEAELAAELARKAG